jgi:lactate permease
VIVASAELVPVIHAWLNTVGIEIPLQGTQTALGWTVEPQMSKRISVFGHPGALIFYSAVVAYTLYALTGQYRKGAAGRICSNTVQSALRSSIGIASMVGFAMIMEQTGMTYLLAVGLSQTVQVIFPILSPFIGVLGTFMTGSNTNSNVVFGGLQLQTAQLLSLPVAIILAAQNTGGSLGSMIAPAKIIVGCSTAGLAGEEGRVLRSTLGYGFLVTLAIGLIAWLLIR